MSTMFNFSKEQIQKILVSVLIMALVIFGYYTFLLKPLNRKIVTTRVAVGEMQKQVDDANVQIRRTRQMETEVAEAKNVLDQLKEFMPDSSPRAWFPPLVADFFKRHDIFPITTRLQTVSDIKQDSLSDYSNLLWNTQLRQADFIKLGYALAGLENEQPLLQVRQLQIEISPDDVEYQRVAMEMTTILDK